jgi:zinc-ribbon domain
MCSKCGAENQAGSRYCLRCGAELFGLTQTPMTMDVWKLVIVDVFLVFASIIFALFTVSYSFYYSIRLWYLVNLGLGALATVSFLFSVASATRDQQKLVKDLLVLGIILLALDVISNAAMTAYTILD